MNPLQVLALAWQVCGRWGGSVTSWIRTAEHNSKAGGVGASKHLMGLAVDVAYDKDFPPLSDLIPLAAAFGCRVVREPAGAAHSTGPHDHFEVIVPR